MNRSRERLSRLIGGHSARIPAVSDMIIASPGENLSFSASPETVQFVVDPYDGDAAPNSVLGAELVATLRVALATERVPPGGRTASRFPWGNPVERPEYGLAVRVQALMGQAGAEVSLSCPLCQAPRQSKARGGQVQRERPGQGGRGRIIDKEGS